MPTTIKDFHIKQNYAKLVYKALWSYLLEGIYKPMFEILDIKPQIKAKNSIEDDNKLIIEALQNGQIFYIENEGFKAKDKFNNRISLIIESWGAKFDKWERLYRLPFDKIPPDILVAISENKILQVQRIKAIEKFLDETIKNIPYMIDSMVFNEEVETILDDAENQIKKNIKKINVIEPKLTKKQKEIIAQEYTNNMRFFIKNWAENKIPEMRAKVQELVLKGYRQDAVAKLLRKEYNIGKNKAAFLAQNETSIMLAEYKKVTYKAMGFDKFIWRTINDGKERELHYQLNGTTWSWDNPPVIDERTGQKGLPGQTYNCRCDAQPYTDDMIFKMHGRINEVDSRAKIDKYLAEYKTKQDERRKAA